MRLFKDRMVTSMMLYFFLDRLPLHGRHRQPPPALPSSQRRLLLPRRYLLAPSPSLLTSRQRRKRLPRLQPEDPPLLPSHSRRNAAASRSLFPRLPHTPPKIQRQQFAYEAIMGLGFGLGLGLSALLVMTPLVVSDHGMAVTVGALTQIRVMGGTLGLATYSTIFNNYIDSSLGPIVSMEGPQRISHSASNIGSLSPSHQNAVRVVLADGYTLQMYIIAGFSGLGFLVSFLMFTGSRGGCRSCEVLYCVTGMSTGSSDREKKKVIAAIKGGLPRPYLGICCVIFTGASKRENCN
jgi:hypothetical protein